MIISFLMTASNTFLSWIIALLPDSDGLPDVVVDSLTLILSSINSISYLFPVDALFGALLIVVLYEAAIWSLFGFLWVFKRIPFIGK